MIQYREILCFIDSAKGTLVSADGAKINRDDYLPRLILADEVILYATFLNINEENNIINVAPKMLDGALNFRIIGDCDRDNSTHVMFAGDYIPSLSDLAAGKIAFRINSNNTRFHEALQNTKSQKGEFVILAQSADPIAAVVLAKDSFIAENRPCENADFTDVNVDEIVTKSELQLLLDLKSPLKHTHSAADISDLENISGTEYTAGSNIEITSNNVINCTVKVPESVQYTAGKGIEITAENVINCTVTPGSGTTYTAGENITISEDGVISAVDTKYSAGGGISISSEGVIRCTIPSNIAGSCIDITGNVVSLQIADERGFNVLNTGLSLNFEVIAAKDDVFAVDQKVNGLQENVTDIGNSLGDINTILDAINGEEI